MVIETERPKKFKIDINSHSWFTSDYVPTSVKFCYSFYHVSFEIYPESYNVEFFFTFPRNYHVIAQQNNFVFA